MAELFASPLFLIVIAIISLSVPAFVLWRTWQVYAGASTRRPVDSSAAALQPPPELMPMISGLIRLGFRRLGESQLVLPIGRRTYTVFVMTDPDGTVIAETGFIAPGTPILVSFNSVYPDSSVVETMYPRGESIEDADFYSNHSTHSLDRAYDDQRVAMNRWRMRHGTPRTISTMADYLRADATFRERFANRKLRRPFIRNQLLPTLLVAILIVGLLLLTVVRWP